jgi:hypothetical protein
MSYLVEKVLGTVSIGAAIVNEVNHTFIDKIPWNGFTLYANNVSFLLIPIWILAVLGLWSEDRLYKSFLFLGEATLFFHGMALAFGGNKSSVFFYFAMFVLSAVCSLFMEWRQRTTYA